MPTPGGLIRRQKSGNEEESDKVRESATSLKYRFSSFHRIISLFVFNPVPLTD